MILTHRIYYVAMVLHDQSVDISEKIKNLEEHLSRIGYPQHAIHTGTIIRNDKAERNAFSKSELEFFHSPRAIRLMRLKK